VWPTDITRDSLGVCGQVYKTCLVSVYTVSPLILSDLVLLLALPVCTVPRQLYAGKRVNTD
jgi:hypothetical protein